MNVTPIRLDALGFDPAPAEGGALFSLPLLDGAPAVEAPAPLGLLVAQAGRPVLTRETQADTASPASRAILDGLGLDMGPEDFTYQHVGKDGAPVSRLDQIRMNGAQPGYAKETGNDTIRVTLFEPSIAKLAGIYDIPVDTVRSYYEVQELASARLLELQRNGGKPNLDDEAINFVTEHYSAQVSPELASRRVREMALDYVAPGDALYDGMRETGRKAVRDVAAQYGFKDADGKPVSGDEILAKMQESLSGYMAGGMTAKQADAAFARDYLSTLTTSPGADPSRFLADVDAAILAGLEQGAERRLAAGSR